MLHRKVAFNRDHRDVGPWVLNFDWLDEFALVHFKFLTANNHRL